MDSSHILEPAFEDGVVIILSANEYYVPFISVVLQSIRDCASPERDYDVIVLNRSITPESQAILKQQVTSDNFSLRFFDAMAVMGDCSHLHLHGHFKLETYFRLIVPQILPKVHKALYLDGDLVVLRDVAELYDTDLDGYLLAAAHDADTAGLYNGWDPTTKKYMDEILKIDNPYDYFQAGVLLLNLDEFRERYTTDEMLKYAASYKWNLLDQDVLNNLAQGHVRFIDMAWNTMIDWQKLRRRCIVALAPDDLQAAYDAAHDEPYIVHYAGPGNKPWESRRVDLDEYFWTFAGRTPYARDLRTMLERNCHSLRGRWTQVGDYWAYRIMLPLGNVAAPPNTRRRAFFYRIYLFFAPEK